MKKRRQKGRVGLARRPKSLTNHALPTPLTHSIFASALPRLKLGSDIAKISRLARLKARFGENFLLRFLNQDELALAKNEKSLAGLWAAKEAAAKALGVGIGLECGFSDIIIFKDSFGAPQLSFSPSVKEKFGVLSATLSISHDGDYAIAVVGLFVNKNIKFNK